MTGSGVVWAEFRHTTDRLPWDLSQQARLLYATLATRYALDDSDHPLSMAWRLAHDLGRDELSRPLAMSMAFDLASYLVYEEVNSPDSYIDVGFVGLADVLAVRADRRYREIGSVDNVFWQDRADRRASFHELAGMRARRDPITLDEALAGDSLSVVLGSLGRYLDSVSEPTRPTTPGLLSLAIALIIDRDLHDFSFDAGMGRLSVPVLATLHAAGLPASTTEPDLIKGAFLAHGISNHVADRWEKALEDSRQTLAGLPEVGVYTDLLETRLQETRNGLAGKAQPPPRPAWSVRREAEGVPTIENAVRMGKAFLLSDPSFEESWEVHRRRVLGREEMVSRFPVGFALESLAAHGLNLTERVDRFVAALTDQSFAYYDHPELPFIDTDTVGMLMRLIPFVSDQDRVRDSVDMLLARVAQAVDSDRIPLWLDAPPGDVILVGEGCGSVEANFLLGVAGYDWERHKDFAEPALHRLLHDFEEHGTGISVNYPPAFLLAVLTRLLRALGISDEAVWARLRDEIAAVDSSTSVSAALLILATASRPTEDLYSETWLTQLLERQRYDGSWDPEPLFFVNGRGGAPTWYSSTTTTTAFCWDAVAARAGREA